MQGQGFSDCPANKQAGSAREVVMGTQLGQLTPTDQKDVPYHHMT